VSRREPRRNVDRRAAICAGVSEKAKAQIASKRPGVQEVVRRMQRQRVRGETLRAIAESLNRDKVAGAQGGKRWYAAPMRHVLIRTT
jgi:hypothetical protein